MSKFFLAISALVSLATSAVAGSPSTDSVSQPPLVRASSPEYPQQSLRMDEQGVVEVSYWIEPSGLTSHCQIVKSSGYPRLDEASCRTISTLEFKADQPEAIGPFSKSFRWEFDPPSDRDHALVALSNPTRGINKTLEGELPKGRRSNVAVYLRVSSSGVVAKCKVRWGSENPKLDGRACEIASKWQYQPFSAKNANELKLELETVFFADPAATNDIGEPLT